MRIYRRAGSRSAGYRCSFNIQGCNIENGAALAVLYSANLESTLEKVVEAGGKISMPVFSFPGGKRFHFTDPNGNEFAVWSDK